METVDSFKNLGKTLLDSATSLLWNSDFVSRTIGMANSYEGITTIVQALGRKPVSLLGKDYPLIFDHVRRNYQQGVTVKGSLYGVNNNIISDYLCPKFTFYKDKPTVKFADPYNDTLSLLDRWTPNLKPNPTYISETTYTYAESDDGSTNNKEVKGSFNDGTAHGGYKSFGILSSCDLLKKTNECFKTGRYNTLIARFHTNDGESKDSTNPTQTAISKEFGMSHGRNLLKKQNPDNPNGYENPYCRTWTYHHQYYRMLDAIRPFDSVDSARVLEDTEGKGKTVSFRTTPIGEYKTDGGSYRLDRHGVLNYDNGFVNIAPTAKIKDYFEHKIDEEGLAEKAVSIKKCMFSIENLAWRDDKMKYDEFEPYGLSAEQRGPLGGRIMWFPPYDINFTETVSVKWNSNEFIGRGENIYTYTNTERRGNLSFTLLIDHPSILDYWARKGQDGEELEKGNSGGVDNRDNEEQTLLRFFAGCDILTAKPQQYWMRNIEPKIKKEEKKVEDNIKAPEEVDTNNKKDYSLTCALYFPNNYSGVDDFPLNEYSEVNAIYYLMNGIGTQKCMDGDKEPLDIPTTVSDEIEIECEGIPLEEKHAGYEINGNISITTKPVYKNDRIKTYDGDKGESFQYLTDERANRYVAKFAGGEYTLAKMVGKNAKDYLGKEDTSKNLWYMNKWYYRIDKDYAIDKLIPAESYIDTQSYELNGKGYESGYQKKYEEEKGEYLISFASLFNALEEDGNKVVTGGDYGVDENHVKLVKKLNKQDGVNITRVEFFGYASKTGYAKRNLTLAENRAKTFKEWLNSKNFPCVGDAEIIVDPEEANGKTDYVNKGQASELVQKALRYASVTIYFNYVTNETANSDANTSTNVYSVSDNTQSEQREYSQDNSRINPNRRIRNGYNSSQDLNSVDFTNSMFNNGEMTDGIVNRYDNEGEFFELIDKKNPFLHNLISEKIKYFDPAFHSISPEGFNARLTFLHQCTRQGATIGNSDDNAQTAYNLAFGRPPVCVLRLGDFYYTKIIINSMTITYDSPQWDLNPEGIGVMPMFAKINIDFNFIGGSDLAGPIARLQNAVSFNYYANTSVYDNRAEQVEYDSTKTGKETIYKPYNYPNKPGRPTKGIIPG